MSDLRSSTVVVSDVLSCVGPALHPLYRGAAESGLAASDFLTVRDLLELSGYVAEEPLHALLLILLAALDEGSLCVEITRERLQRRLADLVSAEAVGTWPQRIVDGLRDHGYPALIGPAEGSDRPIIRRLIADGVFLYFQKFHQHEQALARLLHQRLTAPGLAPALDNLPSTLHEVLEERPIRTAEQGALRLNPEQRLALALALLRSFVIISGGPGTGKTSIVLTALRCLARKAGFDSNRVALAAPTGRAAQRLTDSLRQGLGTLAAPLAPPDAALQEMTAQTLHRLLGYNPERGTFRYHRENPLAMDVVIIDEVSMVGLELMTRLFEALPAQARLIWLGDRDQLPSVDAGAVLANLTATEEQPGYSAAVREAVAASFPDLVLPETASRPLRDTLVVLEKNHRSQPHIQAIARAVNAQDEKFAAAIPVQNGEAVSFAELEQQGGCWRLEKTQELTCWRRVLMRWAAHHYLTGRDGHDSFFARARKVRLPAEAEPGSEHRAELDALFATLNHARILTMVRDGAWGCTGINRFLDLEFRRRLGADGGSRLLAGSAVLITANDYNLQLFNGDVGLALASTSGGYRIVFPRRGGYLSLPLDSLPAHELAFAMTVHKAQGSEYAQVLLALPPAAGQRLLTKEMVYTGITRARNLAIVCGSADALRTATCNRVEREANLLDFAKPAPADL